MSIEVSAVPSSIPDGSTINRPTHAFHPTIWGDYFITHSNSNKIDDSLQQEHEALKCEVRRMVTDATHESSRKLRLIDKIQRLGVAYHFTSEIDDALLLEEGKSDANDLFTIALRFRLLRKQGLKVQSDVFEKFRDSNRKFKSSLVADVQGMLSLYEASYFGIRGEDILDEALTFTTENLRTMLDSLSPYLAGLVRHALYRPLRKCLTRLEARHYISVYPGDEFHNRTLLRFAKLDFNIVQRMHQEELCEMTKWWKNLEVPKNWPYARDRIVECFFWTAATYFEPQYRFARRQLIKLIAMTSILDDTYDNYATLDELEPFTEAIQRMDIKAIDELPAQYMKLYYRVLIETYNEIEEELAQHGGTFGLHYAKEGMKRLARCYFTEAQWREKNLLPKFQEYMQVSLISCGYPLLFLCSFLGLGEIASKEAFEWVSNDPKIVKASALVCRLMDDIVHCKYEKNRYHVASGIECYVNEHKVSEEEVIEMYRVELANAWRDINEEFLRPTAFPARLLECISNLGNSMDIIFEDNGDGYTNPLVLKDHVASLFKDPVY